MCELEERIWERTRREVDNLLAFAAVEPILMAPDRSAFAKAIAFLKTGPSNGRTALEDRPCRWEIQVRAQAQWSYTVVQSMAGVVSIL